MSDLYVDISPRRALTPPLKYTDYIRSGFRTYELHERMTPKIAKLLRGQWLAHVVVYGYRPYDPARGKFTFTRLFCGAAGPRHAE